MLLGGLHVWRGHALPCPWLLILRSFPVPCTPPLQSSWMVQAPASLPQPSGAAVQPMVVDCTFNDGDADDTVSEASSAS